MQAHECALPLPVDRTVLADGTRSRSFKLNYKPFARTRDQRADSANPQHWRLLRAQWHPCGLTQRCATAPALAHRSPQAGFHTSSSQLPPSAGHHDSEASRGHDAIGSRALVGYRQSFTAGGSAQLARRGSFSGVQAASPRTVSGKARAHARGHSSGGGVSLPPPLPLWSPSPDLTCGFYSKPRSISRSRPCSSPPSLWLRIRDCRDSMR